MPKKLNIEERKEEFIEAYLNKPIAEVCEQFNCKHLAVNYYAKRYGVRKKQGKIPERKIIFDDISS